MNLTRAQRDALTECRLAIAKEMEKLIETAEAGWEDMVENAALAAGIDPKTDGTDEDMDNWMGMIDQVVGEAKKQIALDIINPIWALVTPVFGEKHIFDCEFFSEKPRYEEFPENFGDAPFLVYEGNINGGDSIETAVRP